MSRFFTSMGIFDLTYLTLKSLSLARRGKVQVAGDRIERSSQGYEPCEMPLLYPAIVVKLFKL